MNRYTFVLPVVLLWAGLSAAQTVPVFVAAKPLVTGGNPMLPALADFNADGKLDIAVANSSGAGISIFLGNGDGSFRDRRDVAALSNPVALAVGDFNADGMPDLAVAHADDNGTVELFFGDGQGGFQPAAQNIAAGQAVSSIAAADVNGDGNPDLIVSTSGGVVVLLGDGAGGFPAVLNTPVSTCACPERLGWVVLADFDGDGRPDLAVDAASALVVLLGNGDGTFRQAANVGSNPGPMAVGDFNGDGKPDLAVTYRPSNPADAGFVTLYLGNGDGTFSAASTGAVASGLGNPVVGDFNGDGKPDIAVAAIGNRTVTVLPGNGDGTLGTAFTVETPSFSNLLAVGDFDGNGSPDLVASSSNVNTLGVLLNTAGTPPLLALLWLSPATAAGGGAAVQATVFLGGPAPEGGAIVSLSSSNAAVAGLPVAVTIPAGSASATFPVTTAATGRSDISATLNGVTQTATLVVVAVAQTLQVQSPGKVFGPDSVPASVNLAVPAASDTPVALTSSNPDVASVHPSVTVPAGSASAGFTIGVQRVAADTAVTIAAAVGDRNAASVLTVMAPLDNVAVTRAEFSVSRDQLRVEATSSNASATLRVYAATGQLLFTLPNLGGGKFGATFFAAQNPQSIVVRSSLGGVATAPVAAVR